MTLVSPCCRAALTGDGLKCSGCGTAYVAQDGIPVLIAPKFRSSPLFEENDRRYRDGKVPWTYDRTAPEVQKYEMLMDAVSEALPSRHAAIGDVGCSLGVLTEKLCELSDDVAAVDLSPSAVARVKQRLGAKAVLAAASATALPWPDASLDVVLMSDGLVSWKLDEAMKLAALGEAKRVLKPGGRALFMDYLTPRRHHELLDPVRAVFSVERVVYLGDRLWYVTESALRVLKGTAPYDFFAESLKWASAMKALSSLAGPAGSKHLCAVARKPLPVGQEHGARGGTPR